VIGDLNGDGYDDILIGARRADPDGIVDAGAAYVVFGGLVSLGVLDGKDGSVDGIIALSELDGSTGFRLDGAAANDRIQSVHSVGDINADGYDDLVVGALGADPNGSNSGSAYILFGAAGGFASTIDLSTLDGGTGFRIDGLNLGDSLGFSVSGGGDIDGDGFDDIIVGAAFGDFGGADSGGAYVIFGNDFRLEATLIAYSGNENPTGTTAAEILVGDANANTITGGGGADAINAGAGDDSIHVIVDSDNRFFRVDGGGGVDTLYFDVAGTLDLGNIDDNVLTSDRGKIAGIEVLDFTNGSADTITLHKADVLDIDCNVIDALGDASLDNVLVIDGDSGDALTLATADGWALTGSKTVGLDTWDIYATGNVRIAVDQDIGVSLV
jgi:hypothetical protein